MALLLTFVPPCSGSNTRPVHSLGCPHVFCGLCHSPGSPCLVCLPVHKTPARLTTEEEENEVASVSEHPCTPVDSPVKPARTSVLVKWEDGRQATYNLDPLRSPFERALLRLVCQTSSPKSPPATTPQVVVEAGATKVPTPVAAPSWHLLVAVSAFLAALALPLVLFLLGRTGALGHLGIDFYSSVLTTRWIQT